MFLQFQELTDAEQGTGYDVRERYCNYWLVAWTIADANAQRLDDNENDINCHQFAADERWSFRATVTCTIRYNLQRRTMSSNNNY
jgi:hypothetical protein